MRVIWWKITRPTLGSGPVELTGDTLNIHLPEDWSLKDLFPPGEEGLDRDWLNRLLAWSDGPRDPAPHQ